MNYNPILIVSGEPNSVFLEIFFKIQKNYKIINPVILISLQPGALASLFPEFVR